MAEQIDGRVVFTTRVRTAFFNAIEPRAFKGKGDAKYDATFILEPESRDLKAVKEAAISVAKGKWPGRALKELRFPLKDGDDVAAKLKDGDKKRKEAIAGNVLVKADSGEIYPPRLGILKDGKVTELTPDNKGLYKPQFHAGCFIIPQIRFKAYEHPQGDGVKAYLEQVLWVAEGERLGGKSIAETFSGYIGQVSDEDPTKGSEELDDEIAF